jgi:hypothetical protein
MMRIMARWMKATTAGLGPDRPHVDRGQLGKHPRYRPALPVHSVALRLCPPTSLG